MIENIIKKCKKYAVIGASVALLTFSSTSTYAANIFNGVRGPTPWQLDYRMLFAEKENDASSLTQVLILKYWDGDGLGKWGFVGVPYLSGDAKNGFGSVSIGGGPRGKIGKLNWISFGGLTFVDQGDSKSVDKRLGLFTTYLTEDKDLEFTNTLEYRFKGEDALPDELKLGSVAGGKIADKLRAVGGFNGIRKDGDYLINLRALLRYTHSKQFHLEVVGEQGIKSKGIPKGTSIGFYARYNF